MAEEFAQSVDRLPAAIGDALTSQGTVTLIFGYRTSQGRISRGDGRWRAS
jgi:hypothetical protein